MVLSACSRKAIPTALEEGTTTKDLGGGVCLIDRVRHDYLKEVPFNPATDGMASKNMFTDKFAAEIANVMKVYSDYFKLHGEFGSSERYGKLPSDWWMGDDFYSTSRVLFVDLLNPKLQSIEVVRGVQKLLFSLDNDWMILLGHDNDHNAKGEWVGEDGEYWIWITSSKVEIYSERPQDLDHLMDSLKTTK